jgi:predicted ester cyclase
MIPTVLIAQNDWVASHVTWTGMFSNTLSVEQEIPPTGEPINWTELYFFRFNDEGLVTEFWIVNDPAIRLAQLGVVPSEESESEAAEAAPEEPVGYQLMSEEELAATFSSGMEERNLELFNEQVMLGLAQFPQFYADSYIDWSGDFPSLITTADIEQNAPFAEMLSTAMPDSKITPNIIVAEGDWIAGLGTFSGTFTVDVDFFGTPLTHTDEEIVFQLGVVDRYNADGKIVEEWLEGDYSPLFVGLGLG